jgi:hypothetical protein
VLAIAVLVIPGAYVRVGEEMPDFRIKLELGMLLDQDALNLAAFRVPMIQVRLVAKGQSHESLYFGCEIPGRFRRASYVDGFSSRFPNMPKIFASPKSLTEEQSGDNSLLRWFSFLRFEYQKIGHCRLPFRVLEVDQLLGVDPDSVGLARL